LSADFLVELGEGLGEEDEEWRELLETAPEREGVDEKDAFLVMATALLFMLDRGFRMEST